MQIEAAGGQVQPRKESGSVLKIEAGAGGALAADFLGQRGNPSLLDLYAGGIAWGIVSPFLFLLLLHLSHPACQSAWPCLERQIRKAPSWYLLSFMQREDVQGTWAWPMRQMVWPRQWIWRVRLGGRRRM